MKQNILIIITVMIIVFISYFMTIPVYGKEDAEIKPLVVLEGNENTSVYEVDGYVITQNNVKPTIPGAYEIVYKAIDSDKVITRLVQVISKENSEYFNIKTNSIDTFKDYPMTLEIAESLSENKQLLIVKYLTNVEKQLGHIYMYIIEDNIVTKEVQLYYNVEMEINDIVVNGDVFVITGKVWNSYYANYDIILCAYRSDGLMLCNKKIGGNSDDEAFKIEMTNSSYILIGLTSSMDGTFWENKWENSYFIMSIDQDTYDILQVGTEPNEVDFEKIYFLSDSTSLYLVYQSDNTTIKLVNINEKGTYLKTKFVNFTKNIDLRYVYMSKITGNEILIMIETTNEHQECLEVGKITFEQGYEKQGEYLRRGAFVGSKYCNELLTILYQIPEGYKYIVINSNCEKVYEKDIFQTFDSNSHIKMLSNQILEVSPSLDVIKIHKLSYLRILSLGTVMIDEENTDYHDYVVIVNGKKVYHNIDKSVDSVEKNYFGYYQIVYYFEDDIDLIINKTVQVVAQCGVESGKVYDVGLKIFPNALCYLNNQKIEEGYQINNSGIYELELIGNNEANLKIQFEVKNLSVEKGSEERNIKTAKLEVKTEDIVIEPLKFNFYSSDILRDNSSNTWEWLYTIPLLLTIGLGFVIVKFKY